jgi:putative sporulation protein YtaF
MMIGLIFFAIALNIDALMIAVTYGLRRIEIPWLSLLLLSGVSMAALSLSMLMGQALAQIMPPTSAHCLGGLILACLGVQVIWQGQCEQVGKTNSKSKVSNNLEMGQWSLPWTKWPSVIFKEPELLDLDHSGTIMGWEAFLLGTTLALDAVGAGLAVALQGYNIVLTALFVGGGQLIFTRWGLYWGAKASNTAWGRTASIIAGSILILFGLLKVGRLF